MKKTILILLILCLVTVTATAAPLPVPDDYTDEIIQFINEDDPSAGRFVYSYRYPHVDEEAEGGAEINAFFEDLISLSEFESSFNPGTTTITYTITCNNDDYFSVLVRTVRASEEQSTEKWDGHVFSRKNGSPDQTWTLPRLLGICWASWSRMRTTPGCRTGRPKKRMRSSWIWSGSGSKITRKISNTTRTSRRTISLMFFFRKKIISWMKPGIPFFISSRALPHRKPSAF